MKLQELTISRTPTYETNAGQLRGKVILEGSTGKQEIILSPMAILQLFKIVQGECCSTSKSNSKKTAGAFRDVEGEILMIELETPTKEIE